MRLLPVRRAAAVLIAASLAACAPALPPIATASQVDLPRFMGRWHVIASTPTFLDRDAHDAIEAYRLDPDGTIDTTFTFRRGSPTGDEKRYTMRAFVQDKGTNAVWEMQFVWPFRADYRIVHVSPDYRLTVVGREKRDYAWIMARTPTIPDADYNALVRLLADQGYDTATLRRVPQSGAAR